MYRSVNACIGLLYCHSYLFMCLKTSVWFLLFPDKIPAYWWCRPSILWSDDAGRHSMRPHPAASTDASVVRVSAWRPWRSVWTERNVHLWIWSDGAHLSAVFTPSLQVLWEGGRSPLLCRYFCSGTVVRHPPWEREIQASLPAFLDWVIPVT